MSFYNEEIENVFKVGDEFWVFCWDFFVLIEMFLNIGWGENLWIYRVGVVLWYIIYIFR